MNFNLISPTDNGHDYTIRFKEPIDINANSSIKLNFAELTRNGKIILRQDGKITLNVGVNDCFPQQLPSDGSSNLPFGASGTSATITKGTYTFKTFEDALSSAVNTIVSSAVRLTYYQSVNSITHDNLGLVGLNLGRDYEANFYAGLCDFNFTGHPNANAQAVANTSVYEKVGGVNGNFDSFAVDFGKHYWHYQNKSPVADFDSMNFIQFTGKNRVAPSGGQTGRLIMGLYGKEYAVGLGTAPGFPATRTAPALANTIALDANNIPKNFLNVVIEPYTGSIRVQVAINTTGDAYGAPTLWQSQAASIDEMAEVWSKPTASVFNAGEVPDLTLVSYIEEPNFNEGNERPVYVRLYRTSDVDAGFPLWDSKERGLSFNVAFFVADPANNEGLDYDAAGAVGVNARNSQIPFNIALYADTAGEGFKECKFRSIVKTSDAQPPTIVKKYTITADAELASAIGMTELAKDPNVRQIQGQEPNDYLSSISLARVPLDINWRKASYSIFTDLPLNNYKNVNETTDAGFRKAILANIPTPFNSNDVLINPNDGDLAEVISVYEPHLPVVSEMKNNPIRVNNIKIKIVDMETEQLAQDIIGSKINFTVE